MEECLISSVRPVVRWWPKVTLPVGTTVYNLVAVGEEGRGVLFLLEFDGRKHPRNPPPRRLSAYPMAVSGERFRGRMEQWSDYIRQKAFLWLASGCQNERETQLRAELRRWREDLGFATTPFQRRGLPWSPQEEMQIKKAIAQGVSLCELARALGRTQEAIRTRLARMAA